MKVLYTIDNNYAFVAAVSFCSLFENNSGVFFDVIIMTNGLNKNNLKKLDHIFKKYNRNYNIINVKEIDNFLEENNFSKYHNSYVSYYRLFFSKYIDSDDYIIYLDSDTIITGMLHIIRAQIASGLKVIVIWLFIILTKESIFLSCYDEVFDYFCKIGADIIAIYPKEEIYDLWVKKLFDRYNLTKSNSDLKSYLRA